MYCKISKSRESLNRTVWFYKTVGLMRPNDADGMANGVDPTQNAPFLKKLSDLHLHCMLRPLCPNIFYSFMLYPISASHYEIMPAQFSAQYVKIVASPIIATTVDHINHRV